MKKLLLVGLLVVSSMALAEVGLSDKGVKVENVPVKAKVIAPLTISEVKEVDFGYVMQGQEDKNEKTPGGLKITGEKNEGIKVFAKDINGVKFAEWENNETNFEVELKKDGTGSTANEKMTSNLKLTLKGSGTLDGNGDETITINGTVTAGSDQVVGDYSGKLAVKVMYQ